MLRLRYQVRPNMTIFLSDQVIPDSHIPNFIHKCNNNITSFMGLFEIKHLRIQCGRISFLVYTQLQSWINPTSKNWIFLKFLFSTQPIHMTTREQAMRGLQIQLPSARTQKAQFFSIPFYHILVDSHCITIRSSPKRQKLIQ